jgi:hypothetical protein
MAFLEVERPLGIARSVVRILFILSDFARLARSMAISFAFGSLAFLGSCYYQMLIEKLWMTDILLSDEGVSLGRYRPWLGFEGFLDHLTN